MDKATWSAGRSGRLRSPESYHLVGAWYADYRGMVLSPLAHALSLLTSHGMSFHDAYLQVLRRGSIVEVQPWPRGEQASTVRDPE